MRDLPASSPHLPRALSAALDGSGPALRVVARVPDEPTSHGPTPSEPVSHNPVSPEPTPPGPGVPAQVAVVLRTSGSTGAPRDVMLSADALRASGTATLRRIGGPGQWLLVLPPDHVAGLQVLARAALAGTAAHRPPAGPFRAAAFAAAAAAMPATERRYTSIVPTQLVRLLNDETGRAALRGFDAVLLGGTGIPPALLRAARDAGVRVVTTYGMTETCGGAVYDGVGLTGVRWRLEGDGRVWLAGPVLAEGYLGRPDLDAATFAVDATGTRWLRSPDLGHRAADGRLEIVGRADDVIVTGGLNVAPGPVEDLLVTLPGIREACVVGVPDDEWGQGVVAVLVAGPDGPPPLAAIRAAVAERLGAAAAPRRAVVVRALPTRGPGKPDRRAVAALAATPPPA
ncbi:MAG: AMP-binding protein [Micrococcales bacterium]|nr:AMP-binding protein [Micrococcales bacterium]